MKKMCIVTGTRAEYGLLSPLMSRLDSVDDVQLQIIATGAHLSPEYGETYTFIENDGFIIDEKVEILLSSDSAVGVSKTFGLGVMGLAEALVRLKPDMLILLGDRYETLAAAVAASISKIPIAHLHGGETTEGAYDEAFRHAITKMSTVHFTSTESYRKRVIQLGENPSTVFNVGAIGIDNIVNMNLLTKSDLEDSLGLKFNDKLILATFHPVTLENHTSETQFKELLTALDEVDNATIIFTKANADNDGRIINQMIDHYVEQHSDKAIAFTSMGQLRYLSAMSVAHLVIGNSSSGIIEAPSFKVPTVNIGDRQKGRLQAESVINAEPTASSIRQAIQKCDSEAFVKMLETVSNPYGNGDTASRIEDKLIDVVSTIGDLKKVFYDLEVPDV